MSSFITGIALPKNSVCIYFDTHSDLKKFMDILFMNTTSDKQSEMILNAFNKTYDDDWYYDIHLHIFLRKYCLLKHIMDIMICTQIKSISISNTNTKISSAIAVAAGG